MNVDKNTLAKLKRFAQAFKEARDREANESDTVMYLIKFFEEVLGYDSLSGELSKEVAIKDRYCDFGVKLEGNIKLLVEAKSSGNKTLREKDIEQAENYASRSGLRWVLLTNGVEWKLYHVTFNEGEGISHDLAFDVNLIESADNNPDLFWNYISLLTKENIKKDALEDFWSQKKAMAPASLIRVLFSEPVLNVVRRELNRSSEVRLEMSDVFAAIKDVMSKDSLLAAGDITLKHKRKRRKKVKQVDTVTGKTTEVEIETDDDDVEETPKGGTPSESAPAASVPGPTLNT